MASDASWTSPIVSVTTAGSPELIASRRFVTAIPVASSAAWNARSITGPTSSADESSALWASSRVASRLSTASSAAAFSGVPAVAMAVGSMPSSSLRSAWIRTP
jgi:hypothetical protein